LEYKGPTYIRLRRDYTPTVTKDIDYKYEVGKAYILRDGHDITIIGAGVVLREVLVVAKELEKTWAVLVFVFICCVYLL